MMSPVDGGPDMAPKPPGVRHAPAKPWRASVSLVSTLLAGIAAFAYGVAAQRKHTRTPAVTATDLAFTPAVELAELIRRRALSPVELTRAVLERIERLNGRLGAYVLVHAERALKEARQAEHAVMAGQPLGPLHGVPLSIKDNLWTAGEHVTSGSRLLADFV